MDGALCSLSCFRFLTIFRTFSFVHNDLTQVNPKILNQETPRRFRYQSHPDRLKELATRSH
jgi:hypothetical protein